MMIKVQKLDKNALDTLNVKSWPIWTKEVSKFDWYYDSTEHCLILEGRIIVEGNGERVEINAGEYVTFEKGLSCVWHVIEPVRKHYKFE